MVQQGVEGVSVWGSCGFWSLDWMSLWYLATISAISFEVLVGVFIIGSFRHLIVSLGLLSLNLFNHVFFLCTLLLQH